jgi:hypothetical protein
MIARALTDAIGRNQLRVGIDRHERPLIAKPLPIIAPLKMRLLLSHEGPDFIALNAPTIEVAHLVISQFRTAGPDFDHEAHNRVAVRVGHAFR